MKLWSWIVREVVNTDWLIAAACVVAVLLAFAYPGMAFQVARELNSVAQSMTIPGIIDRAMSLDGEGSKPNAVKGIIKRPQGRDFADHFADPEKKDKKKRYGKSEAEKELDEAKRLAERWTNDVLTAEEKYEKEKAKVLELRRKNLITEETLQRALQKLRLERAGDAGKLDKETIPDNKIPTVYTDGLQYGLDADGRTVENGGLESVWAKEYKDAQEFEKFLDRFEEQYNTHLVLSRG